MRTGRSSPEAQQHSAFLGATFSFWRRLDLCSDTGSGVFWQKLSADLGSRVACPDSAGCRLPHNKPWQKQVSEQRSSSGAAGICVGNPKHIHQGGLPWDESVLSICVPPRNLLRFPAIGALLRLTSPLSYNETSFVLACLGLVLRWTVRAAAQGQAPYFSSAGTRHGPSSDRSHCLLWRKRAVGLRSSITVQDSACYWLVQLLPPTGGPSSSSGGLCSKSEPPSPSASATHPLRACQAAFPLLSWLVPCFVNGSPQTELTFGIQVS